MHSRNPFTALGETIRAQRQRNQLPMRTLAERVGISNPYLSQIERGLRAPSDQVLESIAQALGTTSRALHEAAGLTPPGEEAEDVPEPAVLLALREDALLSDTQRRALESVYRAFTEGKVPVRRRRRRRIAAAHSEVAVAAAEAASAAVEAAAAAEASGGGAGRQPGRQRPRLPRQLPHPTRNRRTKPRRTTRPSRATSRRRCDRGAGALPGGRQDAEGADRGASATSALSAKPPYFSRSRIAAT